VNDSELIHLLRNADEAARAPQTGDLVGGAIVRQTRRLRRRRAAAGATLLLLIAAVCRIEMRAPRPVAVARSVGVALPHVDDSAAELELANDTVAALLESEKRRAVEARLRQLQATAIDFPEARETTALLLLKSASYCGAPAERAAVYRQVAGNFPGTGAGTVAKEQLALAR
jgi:hypothetical protein